MRVAAAAVAARAGRARGVREKGFTRRMAAVMRPQEWAARHHGHHAAPRVPEAMRPMNQSAAMMRVRAAVVRSRDLV
jgi:hypothetical protein